MNSNNQNRNNGKVPGGSGFGVLITVMLFTMVVVFMMNSYLRNRSQVEVSYDEFIHDMLDEGIVESVIIEGDTIWIQVKPGDATYSSGQTYYAVMMADYKIADRLLESGVEITEKQPSFFSGIMGIIIEMVLMIALMGVFLYFMYGRMGGGGGIMGVGKSNAKIYVQRETGVTFADVAGEDEAKESLVEIVDFLHNPGKYTKIGAKLPKGALLVGPPGTGKTLLAKAVAGEAHVPFFSLTGSDFVEMFVGVGASRVRDLFKQAQQSAPCIIFIDEIDAIGRSRDSRTGGNDEREQTLNQLLSEMDGFDSSKGLLVMAATNRPEILDPALLRPGRFDRRIIVDKPDLKGRVNILKVHSKGVNLDDTVDFEEIALATSGAVGADLANMMNEAAITAVKKGRSAVSQKDLFEAVELVLVGKEKKDRILSKEERRIVSYHEVGHALVTALQKDTEPVQKITIVPRTMGALGYVMQVPEEEKFLNTKKELDAMLVTALAGRAAEELVFETVTTGASNDIEKATRIARAMVTQYGMSEKFGLMGLETKESQYLSGHTYLNCGDATAAEIDLEVMRILKEAYEEAKRLLSENREAMDEISEFLIERETITGKEFMKIFRKVKGIPEPPEEEKPAKSEDQEPRNTVQDNPSYPGGRMPYPPDIPSYPQSGMPYPPNGPQGALPYPPNGYPYPPNSGYGAPGAPGMGMPGQTPYPPYSGPGYPGGNYPGPNYPGPDFPTPGQDGNHDGAMIPPPDCQEPAQPEKEPPRNEADSKKDSEEKGNEQ